MDTQPVEEMGVEVETGNSPSLEPVTADTAEHCADSPGQPESANLEATSSVPKNTTQEETKETTDDVKEGTDKTMTPENWQEEPANQEPEVKENTTSTQTSEDPAGDNMEPVKDPQGAAKETEELEDDGETPAKKPKVANEEEATSNPKKVFCEE